jgi:hypothetical protein
MFRKAWFSVSSILFNSDLNFDMESTFRIVSFKHIPHFYCGGDKRISSWGVYRRVRVGIVADTSCRCSAALEISKHFFLDCPIYLEANTTLIGHLNMATTYYTLDIKGVRRPG